jgi:transcriptional regulator with XRE-family HTH domain
VKENYSETKGYRLRLARKTIGLTQIQLAKEVKTTQQTIHDYEKNKRGSYADTNLLVNISNRCGVTVDWILTGKNLQDKVNIPILSSLKDFLIWLKQNEVGFYKGQKVGFTLQDNSMMTQDNHGDSFKPEDIVIVSLNKCPAPSDYVIAVTASKNSPILFRQLLLKRDSYFLKPLNDEYETILLKPPTKIVAVVIEQRKLF